MRGRTLGAWLGALCVCSAGVVAPAVRAAGNTVADQLWSANHLTAGPSRAATAQKYDRVPLSFEPNVGQFDPRVRFVARGPGYTLFLTKSGATFESTTTATRPSSPQPGANANASLDLWHGPPACIRRHVVRLTVSGGRRAQLVGQGKLTGRVNYFIGNNPARWHTNIPLYREVILRHVYPGIDLRFYGHAGHLEYDWVVGPGADPRKIAMVVDDAAGMRLDPSGNVLFGNGFRQTAPLIYQRIAGTTRFVVGRLALARNRMTLRLGRYDNRRTLVIDPTLAYSTYLGGSNYDAGVGIATDAAGEAFVTGWTQSTNFPTTSGSFQTSFGGNRDAFVTKLNASGTAIVYSTYLGGSGFDTGQAIAVDTFGDTYVTGYTQSTDYPVTLGAFQTSNGGGQNAFVTKLSSTGASLVYSTYLGGSNGDAGFGVALDASGDAYVTGYTVSSNFPTTPGAYQTSYGGRSDAFVTKLNSAGTALVYSTYLGGSGGDGATSIALDLSGEAFVTGYTTSSNFPTTSGVYQTSYGGGSDAFMTKLNALGTALVYSTYVGESSEDNGQAVAVNAGGDAFMTGYTDSSNFPTTSGAYQTTYGGGYDGFVTKLNASGSSLLYSTYLGGSRGDFGQAVAVDAAGDAYVTGDTASTDFPTTVDAYQTSYGGGITNAFLTSFSPDGAMLVYSTYIGGNGEDAGSGVSLDPRGDIYVTGVTASSNFPTTSGAFQTSYGGGLLDAFVTKFDLKSTPALTTAATSPVALGGTIADTATLASAYNPSGSITFSLFGPNNATCTGTPIFTSTDIVDGNGNYASGAFSPLAMGTYRWIASYSGDANNNPATTACNDPGESSLVSGFATSTAPTYIVAGTGPMSCAGDTGITLTLAATVSPSGGIPAGAFTYRDALDAVSLTAVQLRSVQRTGSGGSHTGNSAVIVAQGLQNGVPVTIRIEIHDLGVAACSDTARIQTSTGYDSGTIDIASGVVSTV